MAFIMKTDDKIMTICDKNYDKIMTIYDKIMTK